MGPGYFNNQRPNWIKAYAKAVRKVGKNMANRQYPQVKNWISSQEILGQNPTIHYNSNNTRTTRNSSKSSKRKTRRSRA